MERESNKGKLIPKACCLSGIAGLQKDFSKIKKG